MFLQLHLRCVTTFDQQNLLVDIYSHLYNRLPLPRRGILLRVSNSVRQSSYMYSLQKTSDSSAPSIVAVECMTVVTERHGRAAGFSFPYLGDPGFKYRLGDRLQ
jgi:hypothetical protein